MYKLGDDIFFQFIITSLEFCFVLMCNDDGNYSYYVLLLIESEDISKRYTSNEGPLAGMRNM